MKMENIAFFLNVCKSRLNVPEATLFSPPDIQDDTGPTAMFKVLRVLLFLRSEHPGDVKIDESLLKALAETSREPEPELEPEPEPEPPGPRVEPTPPAAEPEPQPDDEDPEILEAQRAAAEAAEVAQRALETAKAAQVKAAQQAKEKAERVAAEKVAAAERLATEKAAAAEKAAADKAEQERIAAAKATKEQELIAAKQKEEIARKAATDAAKAKVTPALAATASATNGAVSLAYLSGKSVTTANSLSEILTCINGELSIESKEELSNSLKGHLLAVEDKILYSTDQELRAFCYETGLGTSLKDVPEGKERRWYVEWILKYGRVGSS